MKYLVMCYTVGIACMSMLHPAALLHAVATSVIVGGFVLASRYQEDKHCV